MKFNEGLNAIMGSQSKLDILRFLANNPGEYTGRDLAFRTASSPSQVNRTLKELENNGILLRKPAGKSNLYSLNNEHVFTQEIQQLFQKESTALDDVASMVHQKIGDDLEHLIVFGSVARGEEDPASDIDMLAVLKDEAPSQAYIDSSFEITNLSVALTGSPAHLVFIHENELKKKEAGEKRAMWRDIFGEKPIIIYDFKQHELRRKKIPKGKYLLQTLEINK